MDNAYDIKSIFQEMELELIKSMRRNLSRHLKEEDKEGFSWSMWQTEQLKALETFRKENKEVFNKKFDIINAEIASFLEDVYKTSGLEQEKSILNYLNGIGKNLSNSNQGIEGAFFKLNKKKMNALINASTKDLKVAEHAMLRFTNDQYRQIIYKTQAFLNSGTVTLDKAIDMATDDFLKAGINCIQYKDGRRVNIASYAEMALRTANKRAVLVSEGDVRKAYGIHTIKISKYGQCSETCFPWQGKRYVDDVFSGGTKEEAEKYHVQLLSIAIAGGLFHPNCKHRATTWFPNILLVDDGKPRDKTQTVDLQFENPPEEQEHRKNQLHIQQQKRLEVGSIDPHKVAIAKARKEQWIEKDKALMATVDDFKTVEDVEKALESSGWFKKIDDATKQALASVGTRQFSLEGVDIDGAKSIYNTSEKFFEKYPQMKGYVTQLNSGILKNGASAETFSIKGGSGESAVKVNKKVYGNYKHLMESTVDDVKRGESPQGTTGDSILMHEFGHTLDAYLSDAKKVFGLDKYGEPKRASKELRRKVLRKLKMDKYDVAKEVSSYAAKSQSEWFAECFAEYMDSDNPRPMAAELGKQLDILMEEINLSDSLREKNKKNLLSESDFDDVLSILKKNKPTAENFRFNELPEVLQDNFKIALSNSSRDTQNILNSCLPNVNFTLGDLKYGNEVTFFNRERNLINISLTETNISTIAHEIFHYIDANTDYVDYIKITKAIKKDFEKLLSVSNDDVVSYLCSEYSAFVRKNKKGEIRLKPKFSGISDIISAASESKINLGYAHKKDYWDEETIPAEAWAQFGRVSFQNDEDVSLLMQELFPTLTFECDKIMKGIIKNEGIKKKHIW